MTSVRDYHTQAMDLAQLAFLARQHGDFDQAEQLARQAYPLEIQAAELVPNEPQSEPTRSILYASAASLAYQAKAYQVAKRLIIQGLVGNPSPRLEQELNQLYDQVRFEIGFSQPNSPLSDLEPVTVAGVLDYANSAQHLLGMTTSTGMRYYIVVDQQLPKFVQQFYMQPIRVRGHLNRLQNLIYPDQIIPDPN